MNVTRSGNDRPNTIYLDYWWYFPHNPAGAAGGALCGAGFVIAGVTCFDHQSDWEGVTVVLDADSPSGPPAAVSYAQHSGVTRYSWRALQRLWDDGDRGPSAGESTPACGRSCSSRAGRTPSYPTSCRRDKCRVGDLPGKRSKLRHQGEPARRRRSLAPRRAGGLPGGLPGRAAGAPRGCRAGALERLRRRVGNHGVRARGDLHLVPSTGVTGISGPVPASMVRRRGGRVPERRVHASTATLHQPQALRERDHGQRTAAGAGRLVLVRAGCRLLRPRHERGRQHVLPVAQGLAAGARDAARPRRTAVAGLQRRGGSRRDHGRAGGESERRTASSVASRATRA